ncbi:MAG: hypothetical protein PHP23_01545 [Desulfobacterales bacterium]|nr:hypothetical protein [Desulfobacterales bacterium]MDD4071358.1 hypothetical protein [Desulfobacterales bacterium]MDD4392670.1 hypothetical protein [Desulfobacterales bacterium]
MVETNTAEKLIRKHKKSDPVDDVLADDVEAKNIECICPKCGMKHYMNFRWIGRGAPRKYCPECKGRM